MFIGTYDVLRFKNYVEWTYCTPVRNKETDEHTNLEDEYYGVGGVVSYLDIFSCTAGLLPY